MSERRLLRGRLSLAHFGSLLLHVFGEADTVFGKDRSNVSKLDSVVVVIPICQS